VGQPDGAPPAPDRPGPEQSGRGGVRLERGPLPSSSRPPLDPRQSEAVAHAVGSGPVIVLGGPGTGKTTTVVEAIAARVERDGIGPDEILLLCPTRQSALALRDRVSVRLSRTVREPQARAWTSYAFGVLRRRAVLGQDTAPQLISGPEQDHILADLLAGHETGHGRPPRWPSSLTAEIRQLRGFRDELRDLFAQTVERGLTPTDLADLARTQGREDWAAAASVLAEYLEITALRSPGSHDHAGIVDAAARVLAEDRDLAEQERARWRFVVVDDAQEVTAAGHRLLDQLVSGGRDVLLVGDPDAATLTFRGARPHLFTESGHRLRCVDGSPASTVILNRAHRHGPVLRRVVDRVTTRIGAVGGVRHRTVETFPEEDGPTGARVHLLGSAAQEAAFIADWLRRRHLEDGLPWSRMAVVVRSVRAARGLRRHLVTAGVPVSVPGAEVAVRDEPAVTPLRLALRCGVDPGALTAEIAVDLLTGPLGGMDSVGLRRLRRALRAQEHAGGGHRPTEDLLVEALSAPEHLATLDPGTAGRARQVAELLRVAREAVTVPGASAETVLWALWQATGVAEVWRRRALSGGESGTRADRDLDAVLALFEAAARFTDRLPQAGPGEFLDYLEGQELPADTLAPRAPAGDEVTLVTAQGSAGREWDAVAVPGLQEGSWPDLRLRGSLLGAQLLADLLDGRVGPDQDVAGQRRAVLDDELRLFLVAVSRARQQLLVTAVRSEEDLPSPLLDLVEPLPPEDEHRPVSAVPRAMTLSALVAELRAVLLTEDAPEALRMSAARHLAELAEGGVPGADPDDWYGLAPLSADGPLRDARSVVRVSPSKVEQITRCPLRWLLEGSGGTSPSTVAQALGTVIHRVAELAPDGTREQLEALLRTELDRVDLGSGWVAGKNEQRALAMIGKLAEYIVDARLRGRQVLAVEHRVDVRVGRARLLGSIDRVEQDASGAVVVVDLKTGRSAPRHADVDRNAQLGVYQVAVDEGGAGPSAGGGSGGAELVQLGVNTVAVKVQRQPPLAEDPEDPDWARTLLVDAAEQMAGSRFPAVGNDLCSVCQVRRSCPLRVEGRQVGE
jgi:superfamily I DNA/RNA helicase/RecB family exonuclease